MFWCRSCWKVIKSKYYLSCLEYYVTVVWMFHIKGKNSKKWYQDIDSRPLNRVGNWQTYLVVSKVQLDFVMEVPSEPLMLSLKK